MQIIETKLKGLFVLTPERHEDERGFFMEIYRTTLFEKIGYPVHFVQENQTSSKKGVVRGLHFQWEPMLGKLIRVVRGSIYAVTVDIRKNSETLGQWVSEELSEENAKQIFAPPGFATGFCVFSDSADVEYHYTAFYNPEGESNIIWNDPDLAISWPVADPTLSPRDAGAGTFKEWLARSESNLF